MSTNNEIKNKYIVLLTVYENREVIEQKFIECDTQEEAQQTEKELLELYSREQVETSIYQL